MRSNIGNDPAVGSPTAALLRLLFPLNPVGRVSSTIITSLLLSQRSSLVKATGGVYKGQGLIPGGMVNQPVRGIPGWDRDKKLTDVCPH